MPYHFLLLQSRDDNNNMKGVNKLLQPVLITIKISESITLKMVNIFLRFIFLVVNPFTDDGEHQSAHL